MKSVFYFGEPAGITVPIGAHGGAREESNPDRNQPPTSLDPDISCPSLSAASISNQGRRRTQGWFVFALEIVSQSQVHVNFSFVQYRLWVGRSESVHMPNPVIWCHCFNSED